jgi:PAS domain S-box-containing protein
VGYFTLDRHGVILEANQTGARRLGMEKSQVTGVPFVLKVAPEDRKLFHAHLQKVFTSRVSQSCEVKLSPREGVFSHFILESIAIYDYKGENPQCRIALTDITEIKQAEQEIARLGSFPQLNPDPILEIDLTGTITFYNEAALTKLRKLGFEDLRSLLPGDLDKTIAAIRQKGAKGFCLEIKKADVVFFVHALYTPQCQAIRFYYTDVTERKREERALQESESRLRAIFEQVAVGVAQLETATGRFIRVNNKFCEIVGLSSEEMTATNFMAITLPEDLEVDLQYIQKLLHGQIRNFSREKRYLRQDGSVLWVNLTVSPMWKVGEAPNYHIAVVEDITARKAAETERDRLFNLSIDMLCIAGFDGYFKQLNPAWSKTLGWTETELLSQPWLTFVYPEDRQATIAIEERLTNGEPVYVFDNRYRCRDGSYRWISWRSFPLAREGLIFAVARDVTEEKQAKEAIRSREAKLRSIFQMAPIGIGMSVNRVIMEVNDHLCSLTGYTREELLGGDRPGCFTPATMTMMQSDANCMARSKKPAQASWKPAGGARTGKLSRYCCIPLSWSLMIRTQA